MDSKQTIIDDPAVAEEEQAQVEQIRAQFLKYNNAYKKMLHDNTVALKKQFVNRVFASLNLDRYKVQ